jgi:hypothetical protein
MIHREICFSEVDWFAQGEVQWHAFLCLQR